MEKLFALYLSASVSASVLILILSCAKRLWRRRLSRAWQYYIWLLAVFRLLLPLPLSAGIIGTAAETGVTAISRKASSMGPSQARLLEEAVPGFSVQPAEAKLSPAGQTGEEALALAGQAPGEALNQFSPPAGAAANPLQGLFTRLWIAWLLPAAWLLAYRIVGYRRYFHSLQSTRRPVLDPVILQSCRETGRELGLLEEPPIYYSPAVVSPMLAGVIKPYILLPENSFSLQELHYIFLHELIHFKRRDPLYKWLVQFSVCLHWFNPLVRLMRRECDRACELSCDEAVSGPLSSGGRKAYGDTLISVLRSPAGLSKRTVSLSLCENSYFLKERLGSIMKTKKPSRIQRAAACLLTLLLASLVFCLGGFPSQAKEEPADEEDTYVTDPWLNDTSGAESGKWSHSFQCKGFFASGYGVKLAWNNDPSLYGTTRQVTDGDTYTVSFTEETAKYADNPQVLDCLQQAISEQRQSEAGSHSNWRFTMTAPVVVEVRGPYSETYDQLAVQFYEEGELVYYSAVIKKASGQTRAALISRAYEEGNIAFFSCSTEYLSAAEKKDYLKKSYQENKISLFSILAGDSEPEILRPLAERAYEENSLEFYCVSCESLPAGDQKSFAYRAHEENRLEFFATVCDSLDSRECEALAKRAREENKTDFWYLISAIQQENF